MKNIRNLLQAARELDQSVLYYHIYQSRSAIIQPGGKYPNFLITRKIRDYLTLIILRENPTRENYGVVTRSYSKFPTRREGRRCGTRIV